MSSGASTSERITAAAKDAFEKARTRLAGMSKPAKILAASTFVAAALIIGFVSWKSSETTWSTLFTGLDREDAAAIAAKLKEQKVPYRIGEDGSTIAVPEEKARELRLELASAGLPRGGGVGFESFDKMRLGATEFEQRVLFRRALEGELSRTIDTIAAVQSARVHLVLPERSVFVGRSDPASASVVLKLRGGRMLGPGEVAGIVHLVASSVAGLTPERVAIVTTEGTMLHKPKKPGEEASDEDQAQSARSLEANLEERARAMLERVVGPGHVDVRVSADLDRSRVERVEDHYDPKQIVRSEQRTVERSNVDPGATGVPGAESNLPNGSAKPDGSGAPGGITRESSTRNFEVDHVTEKRLLLGGSIHRLTVAVVVDGQGRSKEEIERLGALVRSAVGADDRRGDVVTIDSVPFLATDTAPPVPPPSAFPIPPVARKYAPFAAAGVVALLALGIVLGLRRRSKRAKAAAAAAAKAAAESVNTLAVIDAPVIVEPGPEVAIAPAELRSKAHERAASDPATAALVLRFWLDAREAARDGTPLA